MNAPPETNWSQEEAMDQIVAQDIDFSNLLDLAEMDVGNFTLPDHSPNDPSHNQHFAVQHPNTPFDGGISNPANNTSAHDFAQSDWDMAMDLGASAIMVSQANSQENVQALHHMDGQMWNDQNQHDMGGQMVGMIFRQPQQVPPTPNSYELQGSAGFHDQTSLNRQQQAFLQRQVQHQMHLQQIKRDTFTPLVSPAVTPQDSTFHPVPQYAVSGAYFSPLTSPALDGQPPPSLYGQGPYTRPGTAEPSATTSPMTNEIDMGMFSTDGTPLSGKPRKPRGKSHTSRPATSRSVRQSPIVKAQKRKSVTLNTSLSNQELRTMLRDPQAQNMPSRQKAYLTDSSGQGSISPEPLDSTMGPPPLPASTSNQQSPVIYAQMNATKRLLNDSGEPATPASLMSIDNPPRQQNGQTPMGSSRIQPDLALDTSTLDDFALPPSVANNASVPPSPFLDSSNNTPKMAASRKTPKLGPLSTATAGRSSATSSPAILAMASPSVAGTPQFGKDGKGRNCKKRGSVSGNPTLISPALRPKISPSIKPLLPDGAHLTESQHAYLLASKSNYTNLLEGTLLPGVSYPDSLSSGLTSKRTSHKIAEQGRRNRINEALKEMQALLPPPAVRTNSLSKASSAEDQQMSPDMRADEDDDEIDSKMQTDVKTEGKATPKPGKPSKDSLKATSAAAEAKAANSKAATVESAIEYIKLLQQERLSMTQSLEARANEVNDLRKRLQDMEVRFGGQGSSSAESPDTSVGSASRE